MSKPTQHWYRWVKPLTKVVEWNWRCDRGDCYSRSESSRWTSVPLADSSYANEWGALCLHDWIMRFCHRQGTKITAARVFKRSRGIFLAPFIPHFWLIVDRWWSCSPSFFCSAYSTTQSAQLHYISGLTDARLLSDRLKVLALLWTRPCRYLRCHY